LTGDDRLTPVAAAGESLSAREFVAGLGLRVPGARLPRVVGAMIGSLDGRATVDGRAGGLGNPADRALLRELRAAADVVLVGRNTLSTERYATMLDPEQRHDRAAAGRPEQPVVATLSRKPAQLAGVPLLTEPDTTVVVYTDAAPTDPPEGAEIRVLDPLTPSALLADLHEHLGAGLVVCEGGPHLLHELVVAGLLDDLVLTLAPLVVSGDASSIVAGGALEQPLRLRLQSAARAGDHLALHYVR
jgi:riboflavin biosynthesis pyrimidine reductase